MSPLFEGSLPLRCRLFGHKNHRRGILNFASSTPSRYLVKRPTVCVRCGRVLGAANVL